MLQDIRLNGDQQNQFLGDMFEFFLDQGFKQSEGQFFTPMPVTKFILMSLPLETIIKESQRAPKVIDFACGAGHFLNELAAQIKPFVSKHKQTDIHKYYKQIYGIEKEYRLSKVAKVSSFMYSQDEINIIYADALAAQKEVKDGKHQILVSNPPYSVKGFLETLPEKDKKKFQLLNNIDEKSYPTSNSIETFFIERAKQLLTPGGVAGIIVPSSILSNSDGTYTATREIIIKYFDIVGISELGSGTFGKTGTNTVILFLRRKSENPAPADHFKNRVDSWFENETNKNGIFEDEYLVKKYCEHIEITFEDYKTLLQGSPNKKLLEYDIFKEYKRAFDSLTEIKNLQIKKFFRELNTAEQKDELEKRFTAYLKEKEKDKLYYFIIAFNQPNKVVIVKSPNDNKEQKKFLGYEWSAAKGSEGIKYVGNTLEQIETQLYNPANRYDNQKINFYIQQNFTSEPENIRMNYKSLLVLHGLLIC
jgi:type I restriction-modification system DNA methylase subunit